MAILYHFNYHPAVSRIQLDKEWGNLVKGEGAAGCLVMQWRHHIS